MKRLLSLLLVCMLVFVTAACGAEKGDNGQQSETGTANGGKDSDKKYKIVMVAKHEGISWFDDMRKGVEEFAKDYNVDAYQIAPEGGDPAKQVQMVEDLIAQGVDAILVVPNDPTSMAPVLKKAKEKGIVVVSHEASNLTDIVDYDVEAFNNEDFGILMFESLAEAMNYEGKFTGFVGALTMQTHMEWYEAGINYIKEKYPDMEFVSEQPYEDKNDEKIAYDKAQEVLKAYPDLKGVFGTSVSSGSMFALALQEKNNQNIKVVSLALPSVSGPYIKDGYLYKGLSWRPADAGYVSALVAYKILEGEEINTGTDLKRPGYESVTVEGNIIYGDAALEFTKDNVDQYPF